MRCIEYAFCSRLSGESITFHDDHTAGLVGAVHVGGDAPVFARVLGFAVENFQRDDAVRVGDGVIAFRQFFGAPEPLYLSSRGKHGDQSGKSRQEKKEK